MTLAIKLHETLTTLKAVNDIVASGKIQSEYSHNEAKNEYTLILNDDKAVHGFMFDGPLQEALRTLKLSDKYVQKNSQYAGLSNKDFVSSAMDKIFIEEPALIALAKHIELPEGMSKKLLEKWGETPGPQISERSVDDFIDKNYRKNKNDFGAYIIPSILEIDDKRSRGHKAKEEDISSELEDHGMMVIRELKQVYKLLNNKDEALTAGEGTRKIKTELTIHKNRTFSMNISQTNIGQRDHMTELMHVLGQLKEHLKQGHIRYPAKYRTFLREKNPGQKDDLVFDGKTITINEPLAGILLQGDKTLKGKLDKQDSRIFNKRVAEHGLRRVKINIMDTDIGIGNEYKMVNDKSEDIKELDAKTVLGYFELVLSKKAYQASLNNYEKTQEQLAGYKEVFEEKLKSSGHLVGGGGGGGHKDPDHKNERKRDERSWAERTDKNGINEHDGPEFPGGRFH